MSAEWWPKSKLEQSPHPLYDVGFNIGVQAALEAVAERLEADGTLIVNGYLGVKGSAFYDPNRQWLGLEQKGE